MRIFKQQYTDRQGRTKETSKWYVEFVDHNAAIRRLPGFTDKGATEELGRKVLKLVAARSLNEPHSPALTRWVETMPADLRQRLARWGILDTRSVSHSRPLVGHLQEFHSALLHKGDSAAHADLVKGRAARICAGCQFTFSRDIRASKVQKHLADLRSGDDKISHQTSNFYLQAMKQFCRWMVRDGRAHENPVDHLAGLNVKLDRRHDRRSLSAEELSELLTETAAGPVRHKMDGRSRAMLYRVAMETGFRRNELRALTPSCVETESDPPVIVLAAVNVKNRRPTVQVIRPDLAREIKSWLEAAQIAPESRLWPNVTQHTAKMLKADLQAARENWLKDARSDADRMEREQTSFLKYEDSSRRFADFHAQRHSYVSLLTQGNVHPKLAPRLARHSTVELTLARYSHTLLSDEATALDALPDFPSVFASPDNEQTVQQATGTDGRRAVLPSC